MSLHNPVAAIAAYTVLEAVRNRLVWLIVGYLFAGFALAEFAAEVAITETRQVQSAFLGALLRICAVFTVSLFVISSVVREFDDKISELVLSLPIPRASYMLGKLSGFSLLALINALLCGLLLLLYVPVDQAMLWSLSLACELWILTTLSLLCLFTFSQITIALSVVMAFYVLARSIESFQLIAANPILASDSLGQLFMTRFIDAVAFILPDLGRFTSSEWLVYHTGTWGALAPVAAQTAIYVALLSCAALFDLYRKNL